MCREIVRRRLTIPAIAFLEMSRPLNFVGAQTLHFFTPIVSTVLDGDGCRRFAEFLEHRGSIDVLCTHLERMEADATRRDKEPARKRD